MKIYAYSVFDKIAGTYATPFFAVNDEVAKRNFRIILKKLDDLIIRYLDLILVGTFDYDTAKFDNIVRHVVDKGVKVLSERVL